MKDLMGMMGKVKEMQAKMESMQAELEELEAVGESGAGLVKVTLSGRGEMKAVSIDSSLLKEDEGEILEDLIVAAHNLATESVAQAKRDKTAQLTEGLPLPPGMKLPF
ncbi:MAG: YbaB/EbfC family nucleoid-associated protein [Ahrensia sp.]|nr:YbaB/EbfC family nucleoid-associated protein [Ahrensia sp.]